jgi:hypothetical protein
MIKNALHSILLVVIFCIILITVSNYRVPSTNSRNVTSPRSSACVVPMKKVPSIAGIVNISLALIGDSVDNNAVRDWCDYAFESILCSDCDGFADGNQQLRLSNSQNQLETVMCQTKSARIFILQLTNPWGVMRDGNYPDWAGPVANRRLKLEELASQMKWLRTEHSLVMVQSLFWDLLRRNQLQLDSFISNFDDSIETQRLNPEYWRSPYSNEGRNVWISEWRRNFTMLLDEVQTIFPFASWIGIRNWNNVSEIGKTSDRWQYLANPIIAAASSEAREIAAEENVCLLDFHNFNHHLRDEYHPGRQSSLSMVHALLSTTS